MPRPKREFGSIEPRKLKSGRTVYRARYRSPLDGTFVAAPSTFQARIDAEAWLAAERKLTEDPSTWTSPADRQAARLTRPRTFGEYAETWLAGRKVRGRALADTTRQHYRDLLDKHILPTFGEMPLRGIRHEHVDDWYERTLIERPTMRAHAYSLLRTILGTAVDRGILTTANPAKVRGAGNVERHHDPRPATLEQLAVIVEAMPERRRLMVLLAAWCAMRFGELAELRRSDVDTKAGVVKIRRGVVRVRVEDDSDAGHHFEHRVKTPKSAAGVRDVAIPPHLLPMVREHLLQHAAPGRDGLLFPDVDGGHLSTSTFYGRESVGKRKGTGYYYARQEAGRPDLRFHDLRHTGATLAAQTGATLAELMNRLGHSTPGAAMRYQHAAAERDKQIAAKLSEMVENGLV